MSLFIWDFNIYIKSFKNKQSIQIKTITSSSCSLRSSITYNLICSRVQHTIITDKETNTNK